MHMHLTVTHHLLLKPLQLLDMPVMNSPTVMIKLHQLQVIMDKKLVMKRQLLPPQLLQVMMPLDTADMLQLLLRQLMVMTTVKQLITQQITLPVMPLLMRIVVITPPRVIVQIINKPGNNMCLV